MILIARGIFSRDVYWIEKKLPFAEKVTADEGSR